MAMAFGTFCIAKVSISMTSGQFTAAKKASLLLSVYIIHIAKVYGAVLPMNIVSILP